MMLATLAAESPFAAIFPDGVPIISADVSPAWLEGEGLTPCYFVHIPALTVRERVGLAEVFAERSGESAGAVLQEFVRDGLPLRASQVVTITSGGGRKTVSPDDHRN